MRVASPRPFCHWQGHVCPLPGSQHCGDRRCTRQAKLPFLSATSAGTGFGWGGRSRTRPNPPRLGSGGGRRVSHAAGSRAHGAPRLARAEAVRSGAAEGGGCMRVRAGQGRAGLAPRVAPAGAASLSPACGGGGGTWSWRHSPHPVAAPGEAEPGHHAHGSEAQAPLAEGPAQPPGLGGGKRPTSLPAAPGARGLRLGEEHWERLCQPPAPGCSPLAPLLLPPRHSEAFLFPFSSRGRRAG